MKAWAVIGANYGDESKGKHVDYLCRKHHANLVVRFNGGAQAGHTVVTPNGRRHVFHHFGSGTFAGVTTFLSKHFVCNPVLFNQEIVAFGSNRPAVIVDPSCLVTTLWDMTINQAIENKRGALRHGSCGVGFGETIERSLTDQFVIRVRDLTKADKLMAILQRIQHEWVPTRLAQLDIDPVEVSLADSMTAAWFKDVSQFSARVLVLPKINARRIVFEGAQGLLLDQNDQDNFPHVTRSNTGIRNVIELAGDFGVTEVDALYCTRTYLTRHGAGPMIGAAPDDGNLFRVSDDTNVPHDFQGSIRYAELDPYALFDRVLKDAAQMPTAKPMIAVSHCDQAPMSDALEARASYTSNGPTWEHVTETGR